jgi:tetratricopeptide (TPR) repeat protein
MMNRVLCLLVTSVMAGQMLVAQSVDDGKKFLYYERFKSAKETFEKVLQKEPNNVDAIYWLGQTLLNMKDTAGAKDLYQKSLASNNNAPMLLVGNGEIMLMEGKKDEARQQFETAINMTKGKDVDVLNAIGLANVDAKQGDATYAIEKLKQATETRRFKNANTYLIMGKAYRKLIDGGNAVTSYNKALELDDKLAAAKNGIGKIYETQKNPTYYLKAYEEAVQLDTAYAPAYFNLFYHYYFRDVNKAGEYLNHYIANSDQGPETEYIKTDYTYAKGDFAGAKARAEQLIQQYGEEVNPRMYRMIAYTSDTLGDANGAKQAMTTFLQKADTADILPTDYEELAKINSKIPGMEQEVISNYKLAIEKDTSMENKLKLIDNAAALSKKMGDKNGQAEWLGVSYRMQPDPSARDLYNWAYAHYQAGNYKTADSLFCGDYISKYPDQIYGYLWCARSKQAQDTSMQQGLAVDAYKVLAKKAIEVDTTANGQLKPYAINALFYLVQYYNDIAKEKDTAIYYTKEVLNIDPENENAKNVLKILTAPPKKATSAADKLNCNTDNC